MSALVKIGLWNPELLSADVNAICSLFKGNSAERDDGQVELKALWRSFARGGRSLLGDAQVEESGTVRIGTRTGSHLTSALVLDALQKRDER